MGQEGVRKFFAWCYHLSQQEDNTTIGLVAHNGRNFDFEILMSCMRRYHIPAPQFPVKLVDTLPCLDPYRAVFGNIKLQTLRNSLLNGGTQSHDAVDDCYDLKNVIGSLATNQ